MNVFICSRTCLINLRWVSLLLKLQRLGHANWKSIAFQSGHRIDMLLVFKAVYGRQFCQGAERLYARCSDPSLGSPENASAFRVRGWNLPDTRFGGKPRFPSNRTSLRFPTTAEFCAPISYLANGSVNFHRAFLAATNHPRVAFSFNEKCTTLGRSKQALVWETHKHLGSNTYSWSVNI